MRLLKRIPTEAELDLLMLQQEQQKMHKTVAEQISRSSVEEFWQRAKQEGGMLAASKRPLQRNPTDEEIKLLQKRRRCRFNHVVAEKGSFRREMEEEGILKLCGVHGRPVPSMQADRIARQWVDECASAAKARAYIQAKRAALCAGWFTLPDREARKGSGSAQASGQRGSHFAPHGREF